MSEQNEFYTVQEVADLLKISYGTAYRMVQAGKIPSVKIGRAYRIQRDKLYLWIEQRTTYGSPSSDENTGS